MKKIYHIYDKAFKRILTLSGKSVINLINGLFGTDYPTDSKITYNWTENTDTELKRTLADSILTINGRDSYHMEAQMTEDEEIVFRVFEYGYQHAYKNRIVVSGGERLVFPEARIIYMDEGKKDSIPDEYILTLDFREQGVFTYKVPVVKLQNMEAKELNDKKLFALLPFLLLKLRKKMSQIRSEENMEELKNLLLNDIMSTINRNEEIGNISISDAIDLKELTLRLYEEIYAKYSELEGFTMRLFDQSMELFTDRYDKTVEELQEEMQDIIEKSKAEIEQRDAEIERQNARIRELEEMLSKK